jgi:hypothetical protein
LRQLAALLGLSTILGSPPAQDLTVIPQQPSLLADQLERAWNAKDVDAYLGLWSFVSPEARESEGESASAQFAAEGTQLEIQRPDSVPPGATRLSVNARAFSVSEPRGRVEQWRLLFERKPEGWLATGREPLGSLEGLVHLSLHPDGFKADGLTLRFEDFEIRFLHGTLFTPPASLGPTALVFVGEGTVRMKPRPAAEHEQLRQFCGARELVERTSRVFVRIHPADLHRVLQPARFTPDPDSARRFAQARKFYDEHAERSFLIDVALPRSPWWLFPSLGDATATFKTKRRGTLTYSVAAAEPEAISLFDRARRRQICLYPKDGFETEYSEDDGRAVDIAEHDLRLRFEPSRRFLEGADTLRLRLLSASSTIRLRLDDAFAVQSVTSLEGGAHLFFRVRGQNSLVVSLGALAGRTGELELTVRYRGIHAPEGIDRETMQAPALGEEDETVIEEALVYSNKTAWYPQGSSDDYALARIRFEVPSGFAALTGGTRATTRAADGRSVFEYRQSRPGKYITAVLGRLQESLSRDAGSLHLEAFGVSRARAESARQIEKALEILRYFESEFGPYPYDSLRLALIEGRTPGGHSPPGMIVLAQRPLLLRGGLKDDPASFSDIPGFFLAHELAHQWWGHGVAGRNYHERWLAEGMAQYAAALWTRHSLGEAAFRNVLGRLGRWALAESDKGPISLGHRLGHIKGDPQIYRAIVYNKGALVLHMLRGIVGEDAFRRALGDFQTAHRFGKAGSDEFRVVLETASGKNLAPYFETWIHGTALPQLTVSERLEAGPAPRAVVSVAVRDLPGPVPLLIGVTHDAGTESRAVSLDPGGGTFTVPTPAPPRKVEVNSDRGLLIRLRRR